MNIKTFITLLVLLYSPLYLLEAKHKEKKEKWQLVPLDQVLVDGTIRQCGVHVEDDNSIIYYFLGNDWLIGSSSYNCTEAFRDWKNNSTHSIENTHIYYNI